MLPRGRRTRRSLTAPPGTLDGIPGATPELERALRAGLAFKLEDRIESPAALAAAIGAVGDNEQGASLAVSLARLGLGWSAIELAPGQGIAAATAESGKAQIVPQCRTDPRFAAEVATSTGYVPHTMLVVPLRRDGSVVGVLSLLDRRGGDPYGADDVPRAELFAELAAASLA